MYLFGRHINQLTNEQRKQQTTITATITRRRRAIVTTIQMEIYPLGTFGLIGWSVDFLCSFPLTVSICLGHGLLSTLWTCNYMCKCICIFKLLSVAAYVNVSVSVMCICICICVCAGCSFCMNETHFWNIFVAWKDLQKFPLQFVNKLRARDRLAQ